MKFLIFCGHRGTSNIPVLLLLYCFPVVFVLHICCHWLWWLNFCMLVFDVFKVIKMFNLVDWLLAHVKLHLDLIFITKVQKSYPWIVFQIFLLISLTQLPFGNLLSSLGQNFFSCWPAQPGGLLAPPCPSCYHSFCWLLSCSICCPYQQWGEEGCCSQPANR